MSLSLSNDTLLVGEPLTVTAVVNATQGKVLFYINNVLNDTVDVDRNGVAVLTLSNFYYGGYNVTAVLVLIGLHFLFIPILFLKLVVGIVIGRLTEMLLFRLELKISLAIILMMVMWSF